MLSGAIHIIEFVLYIYFAVCVGYIVIFSVASCFFKSQQYPQSHDFKRFAILIPAYKEDNVILDCIHSVLQQTYPEQLYDVIVVSDGMDDATNHLLYLESRITLLKIQEQESSKAKALRLATEHISYLRYDYVIILDADNLIPTDYLYELNKAVSQGAKAIQTHRKAKNLNSDTAILDAVIEEMNNTIFRKGHIQLGFSSALIGSGMVFDFQWFKQNIIHTHSAGEDKELEELLLSQGIHIEYADSIETLDEKVQKADSMRHQRRRWMATQLFLALKSPIGLLVSMSPLTAVSYTSSPSSSTCTFLAYGNTISRSLTTISSHNLSKEGVVIFTLLRFPSRKFISLFLLPKSSNSFFQISIQLCSFCPIIQDLTI